MTKRSYCNRHDHRWSKPDECPACLEEENAALKEHKERYPPDFIDKLQQDIDERDVTIARLAKENTELLIVLDLFVLKGAPGGSGG